MYEAKVIADSISLFGHRLTTIEVEYPHAVHKDIMTHRMFDRNFLSFRAFPPEKVIPKIKSDPFIPDEFRSRVKGMGEGDALDAYNQGLLNSIWIDHIRHGLETAEFFLGHEIAKAQTNFILQDLTWIRGIITATDWDNFWALRSWPDNVRPEVKKIASMMEEAHTASEPRVLREGEWHFPYIDNADYELARGMLRGLATYEYEDERTELLKKVSTARCARISYLTHDGHRRLEEDLRLYGNLYDDGHMSPFGHVARPFSQEEINAVRNAQHAIRKVNLGLIGDTMASQVEYLGNLHGWVQHRKEIPNESNYALRN
jgi:hypothetical protein